MTTLLIPEVGELRHVDLCELKVTLVYTENSRTAKATQRPCLKTKQQNKLDIKRARAEHLSKSQL